MPRYTKGDLYYGQSEAINEDSDFLSAAAYKLQYNASDSYDKVSENFFVGANTSVVGFMDARFDPYESIQKFGTTEGSHQKETDRVNGIVANEKARIAAQGDSHAYNRSDFFSIGTVYLTIPPTQISITNDTHNYRFSTLRQPGETIMTSGRATTRVDLDIVFAGLDDINNKLRPLLAQFKTTPFLPVENEYISSVLNPMGMGLLDTEKLNNKEAQLKAMLKSNHYVNELVDIEQKSAGEGQKVITKINELQKKNYISSGFASKLRTWMSEPSVIVLEELDREDFMENNIGRKVIDWSHYIKRNITVPLSNETNLPEVESSLLEIRNNMAEIELLKARQASLSSGMQEDRFKDRQIVMVLSQLAISTVPGFPDTLSCRLSMYPFNYDPFSIEYTFISGYDKNKATPDITKCELFIDWYSKRWLSESKSLDAPGLGTYSGDSSLSIAYHTEINAVSSNNTKDIIEQGILTKDELVTGEGIVTTGITVSIKNVIQFLPLLSQKNATCQYMGSMNGDAVITFEATDISKVKQLFKMIEKIGIASRVSNRVSRKNFLRVNNDLLSFLAMPNYMVGDCSVDTIQGNPGLYSIKLGLIEYKINQEDFQNLNREGVTSQDEVLAAAEWMMVQANEYAQGKNNYEVYYNTVMGDKNGWFSENRTIVSDFVTWLGDGEETNTELRKTLFNRSKDIPLSSAIAKSVGQISGVAAKSVTPAPLQNQLDKLGKQFGFDWGDQYIAPKPSPGIRQKFGLTPELKDTDALAAAFKRSIQNGYINTDGELNDAGKFFQDNVSLMAGVAAATKRRDIVEYILNDPLLNEALNTGITMDGKLIKRSTQAIDGQISYCYPDLELPRYQDLPNGNTLKNTYSELGIPCIPEDKNTSPESSAAIVDPDFYLFKGSMWNKVDQSYSDDNLDKSLQYYRGLGEANTDFTRTKAPDEATESLSLAQKHKERTKYNRYDKDATNLDVDLKTQLETTPSLVYPGSVYDGDTLVVENNGMTYTVRVIGVNTPETAENQKAYANDKETAEKAKSFVNNLIFGGTDGTKPVEVQLSAITGIDSFNRIKGTVLVTNPVTKKTTDLSVEILKESASLNTSYFSDPNNSLNSTYRNVWRSRVETVLRASQDENYTGSAILTAAVKVGAIAIGLALAPEAAAAIGAVVIAHEAVTGIQGLIDATKFLWSTPQSLSNNKSSEKVAQITADVTGMLPRQTQAAIFGVPIEEVTNDFAGVVADATMKETPNNGLRRFDRYATKTIDIISDKIRESQKDNVLRVSRAFPTFKVYFIEEDNPDWGLMDDLYSFQAVASIDITKSRQEAADVAVLTLFNTKGNLDTSLFGLYDTNGKYIPRGVTESTRLIDQETNVEQNLYDFVLKAGTVIKIKMGYSSHPNELDTVFTGVVAEVSGGDMITVVAQGFGVEMLHMVPSNGRMVEAASAPKVLDSIIKSPECKHLGKWVWFPRLDLSSKIFGRRYDKDPKTGDYVAPSFWRRIGGIEWIMKLGNDTRDDNIWIPERSWRYNMCHGGYQWFETKDKTVWDVFKEMERRWPGYIATVLPFDNRATAYFGPADFMYNYTSTKRYTQNLWQSKLESALRLEPEKIITDQLDNNGFRVVKIPEMRAFAFQLGKQLTKTMKTAWSGTFGLLEGGWETSIINDLSLIADGAGEPSNRTSASWFVSTKAKAGLEDTDADWRVTSLLDDLDETIKRGEIYPFTIKYDPSKEVVNVEYRTPADPNAVDYNLAHAFAAQEGKEIPKEIPIRYIDKKGKIYSEKAMIDDWKSKKVEDHKTSDPGRKLVRSYHYKDSFHHIIANNIVATSQYMNNRITVEYLLDSTWFGAKSFLRGQGGNSRVSAQIDDDIWPERVKEKIIQEKNARDVVTAWNYALGSLWQEARRMYNGTLVILGDASIKPHDIVMMSDYFTEMFGPFEVEQVTHHFSPETGFVTTIVPSLLCHVNNAMAQGSLFVAGNYMDKTTQLVQDWRNRFSVAGIGIPALGNWAAGVVFWFTGLSQERREPISLTPLVYAGRPLIAGIEGMRQTSLYEAAAGKLTRLQLEIGRIKRNIPEFQKLLEEQISNRGT